MWGVLKSATQEFTTQLANDLSSKSTTGGSDDSLSLQQQKDEAKVSAAHVKKQSSVPAPGIVSGPTSLKVGLKEKLAAASSKDDEDGGWDNDDWGQLLNDTPNAPAAWPLELSAPASLPDMTPAPTAVSAAVPSLAAAVGASAEDEEDIWGDDDDMSQTVSAATSAAVVTPSSALSESLAKASAGPTQTGEQPALRNAMSEVTEHNPWGNDDGWGSLLDDQPSEKDKVAQLATWEPPSERSNNVGSHKADPSRASGSEAISSFRAQYISQGGKDLGSGVSNNIIEGVVQHAPGMDGQPDTESVIDLEKDSRIRLREDDAVHHPCDSATGVAGLAGFAPLMVEEVAVDLESDVTRSGTRASSVAPLGPLRPGHANTKQAAVAVPDGHAAVPTAQGRASELEVQKLTELLEEASRDLYRSQADLREMSEKYADLESKHGDMQGHREANSAAHMATRDAVASLRAQLGDRSAERDAALCQAEAARTDNKALADKLSSANTEIERLRKMFEERDAEAKELGARLQMTDVDRTESHRELASIRGEFKEASCSRDAQESDFGAKLRSSEAEYGIPRVEEWSRQDACAQLKPGGEPQLLAAAVFSDASTSGVDALSASDAPHGELLGARQGERAHNERSPAWAASLCTDVREVVRLESERSRQTMSAELRVLREALTRMHAELKRVAPSAPAALVDSCGRADLL